MNRKFLYTIVLFVLSVACEDIYNPQLRSATDIPVIDARITNNPALNFIQLYYATGFTDNQAAIMITDAKIQLLEKSGVSYNIDHIGSGKYYLNSSLQPGLQYKLKVSLNDEVYESTWETLLPIPEIEKIYIEPYILEEYLKNLNGDPIKRYHEGFRIYADLSANKNIRNYMFQWRSIVQAYILPPRYAPNRPVQYSWMCFYHRSLDNLAEPVTYSNSMEISKHPLTFIQKDYFTYLDTNFLGKYIPRMFPLENDVDDPNSGRSYGSGWIFEIDQFGISEKTFNLYKEISTLLDAKGRLFDPIYTQILGNMNCITNTDMQMLGSFQLNSAIRYQYFLPDVSPPIYFRKIEPLLDIPDNDGWTKLKMPPPFWQK